MSTTSFHEPVLLAEVLRFLGDTRRVFDCTLGGGGHTAALLERGATVVGVDRDPVARASAETRLRAHIEHGTLKVVAATFGDAAASVLDNEVHFDGALIDLGVSSHQFDDETRGFSFREGVALDMRMGGGAIDGNGGMTAAEWLNETPEAELEAAFIRYADERRGRRLAKTIVSRRQSKPFATSDDLVGAIRAVLGPRSGAPDFARLFQAVRIAVNDEFGELERALPAIRDRLAPAGVLVVISYHSGEDRIVKRAFQDWSRACVCPPRQPMCTCGGVAKGETLTKKPIEAGDEEVARNPRARSAKMRVWRKTGPVPSAQYPRAQGSRLTARG
ncbi:MAG TPA: 16S rRNA (cytosine(1402)-N(4))-methyltransferase RsmH [Gemmatimonadaceae bacterium]|nr:16S rRNA (cytosine(1402)-N(4))-methyltransferase RsmH [Gemmatimonadaceae bacterium]